MNQWVNECTNESVALKLNFYCFLNAPSQIEIFVGVPSGSFFFTGMGSRLREDMKVEIKRHWRYAWVALQFCFMLTLLICPSTSALTLNQKDLFSQNSCHRYKT